MSQRILQIHDSDNVLVALTDLSKNNPIEHQGKQYVLVSDIASKHKFSKTDLNTGDEIIMYGVLVGKATQPIQKGELIHVHNIKHASK